MEMQPQFPSDQLNFEGDVEVGRNGRSPGDEHEFLDGADLQDALENQVVNVSDNSQ